MKTLFKGWLGRRGMRRSAAILAFFVPFSACKLEQREVPPLIGPAELGISVRLTASPDILTADGFSTSSIRAHVRDHNGLNIPGMPIVFAIADESGRFADIGSFNTPVIPGGVNVSDRGIVTATTAITDANGIANVNYKAPPRSDATANQSVVVAARPIGDDFSGAMYRNVRIELRSAEPRLFPQNPANLPPTCNFLVEPSVGPYRLSQVLSFQTTAFDNDGTIVRYEWDFGDGTKSDHPDNAKVYRLPNTYTVTHVVTDDDGLQAACTARIVVNQ